tara:strand:+ start:296 stop:1216 length:921 start_codon:yes stop_codon:yes gene_type:complete
VFLILLGSIVGFSLFSHLGQVQDRQPGDTVVRIAVAEDFQEDRVVNVEPLAAQRFKNVVRQAYDYSCGSAALTTLLNHYLGRNFQERQVMEGLLRFGETERIVQRRGFSLLDMKRLATALGHPSGGFKAEASDLEALDHPAIAPIDHAGFKHFVVIKAVYAGRVYIADPALGNISFTLSRFLDVWDNNVLFIIFPDGQKPASGLELQTADLRFVSDYIIAENAYREFPQFYIREEHLVNNAVYASFNNANSSYEIRVDENGDAVRDDNGNPIYDVVITTDDKDSYNIAVPSDSEQTIDKQLRFRRK